jgi:hypothetical protein
MFRRQNHHRNPRRSLLYSQLVIQAVSRPYSLL